VLHPESNIAKEQQGNEFISFSPQVFSSLVSQVLFPYFSRNF